MHWINTYTATVLVRTDAVQSVDERLLRSLSLEEPRVGSSARGWVELEFALEARSLAHACTGATAIARAVTGCEPLACEVGVELAYAASRRVRSQGMLPDVAPPEPPRPRDASA